jgi:hypothetical protein
MLTLRVLCSAQVPGGGPFPLVKKPGMAGAPV